MLACTVGAGSESTSLEKIGAEFGSKSQHRLVCKEMTEDPSAHR